MLRSDLDGASIDQANVQRAAAITKAADEAMHEVEASKTREATDVLMAGAEQAARSQGMVIE